LIEPVYSDYELWLRYHSKTESLISITMMFRLDYYNTLCPKKSM